MSDLLAALREAGYNLKTDKIICPYCGKDAVWCENKEVYGRNYGRSFMCWVCKPCDAYVGCHNNTREPLGTLANAELREARIAAHKVFDPWWKNAGITRKKAYRLISEHFHKEIHIASLNLDWCKVIIAFCARYEIYPQSKTHAPQNHNHN